MVRSSLTEREKRLLAMGQMAATLAHEIRNPLGSMELYCSLLKKDLAAQPENLKLLEAILKGIRTLDGIVANSLQFARDIRVNCQTIPNVGLYLRETLELIAPLAQERGVVLKLENACDTPVYADPLQLQQVLVNLIKNSIDAYPAETQETETRQAPSPEKALVRLSSNFTDNGHWQIQVSDCGVGIPPENIDTIFDPFFTTKQAGTGLGMSVAYSIIKAHGGAVSVESELLKGTSVTILLPPIATMPSPDTWPL